MDDDNAAAEAAFLEFFNTFDIPYRIDSLSDLDDGATLLKILHEIDPDFFSEDVPDATRSERGHWVSKWKALQHIHKECLRYIRDEHDEASALHKNPYPSLRDIATGDNIMEMNKLLEVVLTVVIYSPQKTDYFQRMASSSLPTQSFLMKKIQEITAPTEEEETPEVSEGEAQDKVSRMLESDLQLEEQLVKLVAENKTLQNESRSRQKALDAHRDRLLGIQENNEILREQLMQAEDKLLATETAGVGVGTNAGSMLRKHENRIREQDELIGQYEASIASLQKESDSQTRAIDAFSLEREKAQRNQDLLDETRVKIDDLSRKANTAEHFKQKLEASQGLEKTIRELRLDNERLQARLRKAEEEKTHSQGDQLTIEQYKRTQERIEQDYSQLQTVKRQLELDKDILSRRLDGAAEQQTRDAEVISEQQERIHELESGAAMNGEAGNDLEAELAATDKSTSDLKLEVSRLRGDLQRAKESGETAPENALYKTLSQDAQKKAERFEERFLEAQQFRLVLESQIKALLDGEAGEGSKVFVKLHETYNGVKEDLDKTKATLEQLEAQLRDTKRELSNANTSLSLVDKDKTTQLSELRESVSEELNEVREQYKALQRREDDYRTNLDTQKSVLNNALIDKDRLQKEMVAEKDQRHQAQISNKDLKASLEAFEGRKEGSRDVLEERVRQLHSQIEKTRGKSVKQTEHIKKQKAAMQELERKVQLAETNGQESIVQEKRKQEEAQKTATDQELSTLQRELSLMSTAWYDLSSRLQMPNVAIQRRSEPRSFMNKQRQLINGSMR